MSIIEFDDVLLVRRRASSEAVMASRAAMALVRPFNERLGAWQAEAALLAARSRRARSSGDDDAGATAAAATLQGHIAEQRSRFEAAVAAAPSQLASHSRVVDTRNAFSVVMKRLSEAAS